MTYRAHQAPSHLRRGMSYHSRVERAEARRHLAEYSRRLRTMTRDEAARLYSELTRDKRRLEGHHGRLHEADERSVALERRITHALTRLGTFVRKGERDSSAILTDDRGRPIHKPARSEFPSGPDGTTAFIRAMHSYHDHVHRIANESFARGFRKGMARRDLSTAGYRVETYSQKTPSGRHIRKATKVVFPDGHVVRFMDRFTSKREAIRQAIEVRAREARDQRRRRRRR